MVAVSAISFFFGLQLKTAQDLFNNSVSRDAESAREAWGPDERQRTLGRRNRRGASARRDRMRNRGNRDDVSYNGSSKVVERQKRRQKDARKFDDRNYDDFEPLPWTLPRPTPMRNQTSEEFMADYIAAKRKHNIPLPWEEDEKYADKNVSLPLPVIALNFPKSATLTMSAYFECGGLTSVHTSTQHGRIGICMLENHLNDKPPLNECDTHRPRVGNRYGEAAPIDFISDIGLQGPPCYYASVHDGGLENIAKHYPNATILLVTRDATKWYKSLKSWGSIVVRLNKYCGFDGELHDGENMEYWRNMYNSLPKSKVDYWVNFYHANTQKIREFAMNHLSMTYVEVELENKNFGMILQKYTKVSPECVMYCHPGPFWVKKHNATSKCHPIGQNPADKKNDQVLKDDEEETDDNTDDDNAESGESDDEEIEDDIEIEDEE